MSEVKSPWPTLPLGQIASEMCLGKMLDKEKNRGDLQPYLRNVNVRWFAFDLADLKEMRFEDKEVEKFSLRPGDLVICEGGEPGRAAVWTGQVGGAKIQKALHRVRFREDEFDPYFAMYYLYFGTLSKRFEEAYTGTTISHLTGKALQRLPFPVPPINEQRRIVAKVEELFSIIDAGVATLKRVQAKLKRYRASVLKAAVEGKLTEAWRADHPLTEPAIDLLKRIQPPPRPNRFASRSTDLIVGHAGLAVGHPGTPLPSTWAWSLLADVARLESGHTPSRNHPEWWGGDIPWIGIADAREHDGGVIHETFQQTNKFGIANSAARVLPASTVCLSRTASVGYVIVTGKPMATSQDFVNWICTEAIEPGWLKTVLKVDRNVLLRFGKGSVHKTIYFPEVLSFHIAVPPKAEQAAIVEEVEARLCVIDKLTAQVDANLKRAARLRQSVLKRAFEGKLVPQCATDEPAAALLERIRRPVALATVGVKPGRRNPVLGAFSELGRMIAYVIENARRPFGRKALVKVFYMGQTHLGIPLRQSPKRGEYGPIDFDIYKVERVARKQGWFDFREQAGERERTTYSATPGTPAAAAEAAAFLGERKAAFDQLLAHFDTLTSEGAELFATAYAAWNDLLIDGRPADESAVVAEVHGWNPSKAKFSAEAIVAEIARMRATGYVPTGRGERTAVGETPPARKRGGKR